ncbi:unnamed protein product [Urochloa decumbens]|uniref:Uncharacterized protein n=1 Tax=Urochloa decumbens TaxID=240449 RepID=A0ABC9C224_9POAL
MTEEATQELSSLSQPLGPLPDSDFIASNQLVQRPVPLTTSFKAGKAAIAKKRKGKLTAGKSVADKKWKD